nr:hypothetical protein [uncultured Butyrivibrio sp.]
MSISAYLNPDFTLGKKLIFLLITFIGVGISIGIIYLSASLVLNKKLHGRSREIAMDLAFVDKVQRFFEMLIAGVSVLSFSCSYVIINHIYTLAQSGAAGKLTSTERMLFDMWSEGKDFLLLLLILMSCVINTLLDTFIIPLKKITREEKATIRMLAMFYVIVILMYLNTIGDESQYSPVMMYYFGLMIGRFVYFDASFKDFLVALKNMFFNLPYMALTLILIGLLNLFGFNMGYLLERNYYIVGIFYTHLFLMVCIFVVHVVWMIVAHRNSTVGRS